MNYECYTLGSLISIMKVNYFGLHINIQSMGINVEYCFYFNIQYYFKKVFKKEAKDYSCVFHNIDFLVLTNVLWFSQMLTLEEAR